MILFERRGGVAGARLRATFAPDELTPAEVDAIAALQASPPETGERPDRFEYSLRLPGAEADVLVPESLVPEALRDLFSRLVTKARSGED